MSSGAAPVLAWAAALTFLTAVLFAWTPGAELQWGPFALASSAAWTIGGAVLVRRRGRAVAVLAPRSGASTLLAVGLALAANALVFGWWLAVVGAAVAALALGLLRREPR